MSLGRGTVHVLYVAGDGTVRSGRLVESAGPEGEGAATLVSRGGDPLAPGDVRALLALPGSLGPRRAALTRAHEAGYRVEEA